MERSKCSASLPCYLTHGGRASSTHWIGGWLGPKVSLDTSERRKPFCLSSELKHDPSVVQPHNLVSVLTAIPASFLCAWDSIFVTERLIKFMTVGLTVTVVGSCIFNVECWSNFGIVSFVCDACIYLPFLDVPFKVHPLQFDALSPVIVLLLEAFGQVLCFDLGKCSLWSFRNFELFTVSANLSYKKEAHHLWVPRFS
jgi:hypothetical protein